MKQYQSMPPADRLREILNYDPETGAFTWSNLQGQRALAVAGYVNKEGYRIISIDNVQYRAHRLAWVMYYGEPPLIDIDHVNRDTSDNRIVNLRQATVSQNLANSKGHGRSKIKGVQQRGKSYRAYIKADGKFRSLGTFKTSDEASAAYFQAARSVFGEFARSIE